MADEQLGRLLLIKRNAAQDGSGLYENVCGLRDKRLSQTTNKIDRTQADCDDPGGPLVKTISPGIQDHTFTGSGVFHSSARGKAVLDDARLSREWYYQVVVPGYGTYTGPYFVDAELNGPLEGDLEFSGTWSPATPPVFAAA